MMGLPTLPRWIDCFDNSNIQGTSAVAGCVVYRMAKPSKSDYKRFEIKGTEGADDYASMREVVRRRYQSIIDSNGQTVGEAETGYKNSAAYTVIINKILARMSKGE